jgi:hypothetical protein
MPHGKRTIGPGVVYNEVGSGVVYNEVGSGVAYNEVGWGGVYYIMTKIMFYFYFNFLTEI